MSDRQNSLEMNKKNFKQRNNYRKVEPTLWSHTDKRLSLLLGKNNIRDMDLRKKFIILLNRNETYVQCESRTMGKSHLEIH